MKPASPALRLHGLSTHSLAIHSNPIQMTTTVDGTPEEIAELLASEFVLHVRGYDGEEVIGLIHPMSVSHCEAVAGVEWHGTPIVSTLARTGGDESSLGQLLMLVYGAAGPTSVQVIPVLAPDGWSQVRLRLPDPRSTTGDSIQVTLNRDRWTAEFEFSGNSAADSSFEIPEEMRKCEVWTQLAEIGSRVLLQRPGWMTFMKVPV